MFRVLGETSLDLHLSGTNHPGDAGQVEQII